MDQVNIRVGSVVFDVADYDAESDVLDLHVGEPREAEGEETPEGHVLHFEPGTQRIVGLTVLGAQAILDRDGELRITMPEQAKASADDLAPALVALPAGYRLPKGATMADVRRLDQELLGSEESEAQGHKGKRGREKAPWEGK
jgi:hypothetical protein